ncbi:MAG: penicillin-binding transpeptidase domain-containing protein, partial [Oscillospiraceae bacterium]
MKKIADARLNILMLFIMSVFLIFGVKLIQYQLIGGEEYYKKSNASTRISQTIYAARGDIVDVNGVAMASGRSVFSVVINKAYMPPNQLNERILQTLEILDRNSEEINDILPMEANYPYKFKSDKETEISRLREMLTLAVYATEEDVLSKLSERYSLTEYSSQQQRILGGIRYTMERAGYSAEYPFTLAKDVSMVTVSIITERSQELPGIEISESSQRYYEDGTLLPHVLGTVGPIYAEEYEQLKSQGYNINDMLGKDGLEKIYENYLKGTDGTRQIEKNINGEIVDMVVEQEPKPGNTLKLTIDAEFQKAANDILANQVVSLQGRTAGWGKECTGASMVVIDVKTGAVLAICNYPTYDLNMYSSNYDEYASNADTPLFNRALQGLYRPGSVFKVSVAVAALQAGLIDENFTYTCHGTYNYYTQEQWGSSVPGCSGYKAHGTINVEQALKVSCNCFFYDLGRRLGIEKINETANNLGLAVKTGLEVNEKQGSLSSPEQKELAGQTWQAG